MKKLTKNPLETIQKSGSKLPFSLQDIFCSLDIETSGFDPLTNEVLEVGFAFFKFSGQAFEVTEEYTQVFRPAKEVPPQILGLTGITLKELEQAPKFSEHRDFIQKKLGNATILGHNISFDVKFLEGFGIKFSGKLIDTLDLAQFILPTHHSYNLENLMYTFGISHKEAHRALADSKATLKLLEKLLQVYASLPEKLKKQINKLAKPHKFPWQEFLAMELPPLVFSELVAKSPKKKQKIASGLVSLEGKIFYDFPLGENYPAKLAQIKSKQKNLLVVPKAQAALELWREGITEQSIFLPEWQFAPKKMAAWLKKKDLSVDETKFLLKILVWQQTNWQTETVMDLNLSFFGGQFKTQITGGEIKPNTSAKVTACDMGTFLFLAEHGLYKNFRAIICGLSEFEAAVSAGIGTKTSWGYITYLLKSFYNPEFNSGEKKFESSVQQGLLAADLFFGLVNALLQTNPPSFLYFKLTEAVKLEEKYLKIKSAAASFIEKLTVVNKDLESKQLELAVKALEEFFEEQENRIKWIELAENRCTFLSMPLDITGLVKGALKNFSSVSLADNLGTEILPDFFLSRLGLKNFKIKTPSASTLHQQDLFSGLKKIFVGKPSVINYNCLGNTADFKELLTILKAPDSLPAAILFSNPAQVREFYEQNYQELKSRASVLAQTSSGGSNKIFRNFGINQKSILLCTDKFILKSLASQSANEQVSSLAIKTLIICRLPFEQFTHPYQEAVSAALPNSFMDYALPKALFNFHNIIKFFYTPLLKDIYVFDAKLNKDYASVFKDYYKFIPGAELKPK